MKTGHYRKLKYATSSATHFFACKKRLVFKRETDLTGEVLGIGQGFVCCTSAILKTICERGDQQRAVKFMVLFPTTNLLTECADCVGGSLEKRRVETQAMGSKNSTQLHAVSVFDFNFHCYKTKHTKPVQNFPTKAKGFYNSNISDTSPRGAMYKGNVSPKIFRCVANATVGQLLFADKCPKHAQRSRFDFNNNSAASKLDRCP